LQVDPVISTSNNRHNTHIQTHFCKACMQPTDTW